MMTEREKELLNMSGDFYVKFIALGVEEPGGDSPEDLEDLVFHLDALRRIIMARAVRRQDPDFFNGL